MIEIVAIIGLYSWLRKKLLAKGATPELAMLGPVFWILGEIGGCVVNLIIAASQFRKASFSETYIYGLTGAAIGAGIAILIVLGKRPVLAHKCPFCGGRIVTTPTIVSKVKCHKCNRKLIVSGGTVHPADKPKEE